MDIEKLKESLLANGVDEETIAKVIADLEKSDEEDETKKNDDDKTDEQPPADGKSGNDEPPASNDKDGDDDDLPPGSNDGAVSEEGATPPDGDVPPVPQNKDEPPADEPPVPPSDVPPADVPPAEVPPTPTPEVAELLKVVDELKSANDGLIARVDSLEKALAAAGILDASDSEQVGFDESRVPPSSSDGAVDAFDDALAQLNGKRR